MNETPITLDFRVSFTTNGEITEEGVDAVALQVLKKFRDRVQPHVVLANQGCFAQIIKIQEV